MARRSTDLLEVFNRKTPGPSAPRRRGSKGGGKRRTSGDVSGFFLGPRQILLACCVLLLLLVLSFVVGIGMGRRGDAPDLSNTQLRRDSTALPAGEAWYVRGRLAQVHQVRGDRIDPVEIPGALGMNPRHVHVEEAPRGFYDVFVGPFASEVAARQYWEDAQLRSRGRKIAYPFAIPAYVHRARFR